MFVLTMPSRFFTPSAKQSCQTPKSACLSFSIDIKETLILDLNQVELKEGLLVQNVWLDNDDAVAIKADGAGFFQYAQGTAD